MTATRRSQAPLDTVDTTLLKGAGILSIAMHNFLHLVRRTPSENEFDFDPARFHNMVAGLLAEPNSALRQLASYFGHYGVQIFIFLSAYGLTRSFARGVPPYPAFLRRRLSKIYPAFLISAVLWILWDGIRTGSPAGLLMRYGWDLLLKVTLVSNFIPGKALLPVGPWWFLPFIVQFYLVYPLLWRMTERWGAPALAILSAVGVGSMLALQHVQFDFFATVLGHLPEFCLGIYMARQDDFKVPRWMLAPAVLLFALGNVNRTAWYTSHVSALVLMLFAWELVRWRVRSLGLITRAVSFLGVLSMPLFYVNGFMREPVLRWARRSSSNLQHYEYLVLSLAISVAGALLVASLDRAWRRPSKGQSVTSSGTP